MPGISLAQKAYEMIRTDIVTCVLAPGEQVAQPQLVDRYQLGNTPIREALQRLAREGFVEPLPRFGYVVTPVTLADVREMFELRAILEAAAVRLASGRSSDEQLMRVAETAEFTYVYHNRASYSEFLSRNEEFHRSVAVAAGNQRLVDAVSKVLGELTRVFHLGLDLRDSAEEMREEHVLLAQALRSREADRAAEVLSAQIARSLQRVTEALMRGVQGELPGGLVEGIRVDPAVPPP